VNVSLRDLGARDERWLDAWLGACAASVGYDAIDAEAPGRSLLEATDRVGVEVRVIVVDEPVGVMTFQIDSPNAVIEFVGVAPACTRKGYGHAGAALLEEELRAAGLTHIYAPAPAIHGIAVYFWIRRGYRPLLQGDWPCAHVPNGRNGVAWLIRDLA
jgi:hypothetical protein